MNDTKEKSEEKQGAPDIEPKKSWTYRLTFLFLCLTPLSIAMMLIISLAANFFNTVSNCWECNAGSLA